MRNHFIAIALGSNLGNSLDFLRQALKAIKKLKNISVLKVSSIYESDAQLPENASIEWNKKYLNAVVLCQLNLNSSDSQIDEANYQPIDLLNDLKQIEISMGRIRSSGSDGLLKWAPRVIDLDILAWGDVFFKNDQLEVPHPRILERPFVLLPLLEVCESRSSQSLQKLHEFFPVFQNMVLPLWAHPWVQFKPYQTLKSKQFFWPKLVGILNITADSFSDGGKYLNAEALLAQAEQLILDGAEILDIGAESTRPMATAISEEVEFKNLNWALGLLRELKTKTHTTKKTNNGKNNSIEISLDCRHPRVINQVIDQHSVEYINDVSGFNNIEMQNILVNSNLKAFVMHSLTVPAQKDIFLSEDVCPVFQLIQWWSKKKSQLTHLGIKNERFIFDPGIGFGKTDRQSMYVLNNLNLFKDLQDEIMIGHSRKSFLKLFSDRDAIERDFETGLVTRDLNLAFVQFLRLHQLKEQKLSLSY